MQGVTVPCITHVGTGPPQGNKWGKSEGLLWEDGSAPSVDSVLHQVRGCLWGSKCPGAVCVCVCVVCVCELMCVCVMCACSLCVLCMLCALCSLCVCLVCYVVFSVCCECCMLCVLCVVFCVLCMLCAVCCVCCMLCVLCVWCVVYVSCALCVVCSVYVVLCVLCVCVWCVCASTCLMWGRSRATRPARPGFLFAGLDKLWEEGPAGHTPGARPSGLQSHVPTSGEWRGGAQSSCQQGRAEDASPRVTPGALTGLRAPSEARTVMVLTVGGKGTPGEEVDADPTRLMMRLHPSWSSLGSRSQERGSGRPYEGLIPLSGPIAPQPWGLPGGWRRMEEGCWVVVWPSWGSRQRQAGR